MKCTNYLYILHALWLPQVQLLLFSHCTTAFGELSVVSNPVNTSNPIIVAIYAQQTENTFIPCFMGLAGKYCMNVITQPQYFTIDSSIVTRAPAFHTACMPFISLSNTYFTLNIGL